MTTKQPSSLELDGVTVRLAKDVVRIRPTTLADVVEWALRQGVPFDRIEFSAKSAPFYQDDMEGSIEHRPVAYATVGPERSGE